MNPVVIGALSGAGSKLKGLLTNKYFWIAVVVVIVLLVLRKYWNRLSTSLRPDRGDYRDVLPGEVQEYRKVYLEDLAERIHIRTEGYNGASWLAFRYDPRVAVFEEALELPDGELAVMAKHYRKAVNRGQRLSEVIDGEWVIGSSNEELATRLEKLGE